MTEPLVKISQKDLDLLLSKANLPQNSIKTYPQSQPVDPFPSPSPPPPSQSPVKIPQKQHPKPQILHPKLQILLLHSKSSKLYDQEPVTIEQIKEFIVQNIESQEEILVVPEEIKLWFQDFEGEKCVIEEQEDLEHGVVYARQVGSRVLKIIFNVKRGDEGVRFGDPMKKCMKSMILRDGYVFNQHYLTQKGHVMYHCDEVKDGCRGQWVIDLYSTGADYGYLSRNHCLPPEDHACNQTPDKDMRIAACNTISQNNEIITLPNKMLTKYVQYVFERDPCITNSQLLFILKRTFPNLSLPNPHVLRNMMSRAKNFQKFTQLPGFHNLNMLTTIDRKPFGRGFSFTLVDNEPKHCMYLYSDWQKQCVGEVKKQQNIHLFIDGTFKCCPKIWSQLLNFAYFHREKQLFIPIGHCLMQTKKKEGYDVSIRWFIEKLGLKADYITTDFEPALMDSAKELFPNAKLVPCFFHFTKALWMQASKCGMKKKVMLVDSKMILFQLKQLAFIPKEKVYNKFLKLKEQWASKNNIFLKFFEYFEAVWMDGKFKIKDWNYYDKLQEFEDLMVTNNGLESFHQCIKTQLNRTSPNLMNFLETLRRVEAMKKHDYQTDRIKGDPQFNRCWASSTIFRELYSNSQSSASQSSTPPPSPISEAQIESLFTTFDDTDILADTKYTSSTKKIKTRLKKDQQNVDRLWTDIDHVRKKKFDEERVENEVLGEVDLEDILKGL